MRIQVSGGRHSIDDLEREIFDRGTENGLVNRDVQERGDNAGKTYFTTAAQVGLERENDEMLRALGTTNSVTSREEIVGWLEKEGIKLNSGQVNHLVIHRPWT